MTGIVSVWGWEDALEGGCEVKSCEGQRDEDFGKFYVGVKEVGQSV